MSFLRLFLLIAPLLILAACGKSKVDQELDKFRAEGKPVTLEDLGLPKGGYESPEWKDILAVSEELSRDASFKDLEKQYQSLIKPFAPAVWANVTLQSTTENPITNQHVDWAEFEAKTTSIHAALERLPKSKNLTSPVFMPEYGKGAGAKVPHVGVALNLIKATNLLMTTHMAHGRYDAMLDDLDSARTYQDNLLNGRNTLLEGLVDSACDSSLLYSSWALLQHDNLNDKQLIRMQRIWESGIQHRDILHVLQGERITLGESILPLRHPEKLKKHDGTNAKNEYPFNQFPYNSKTKLVKLFITKKWMDHDIGTWLSFFYDIENAVLDWEKTGDYLPLKAQGLKQQRFFDEMGKFERYRYLVCTLALPATHKALNKFVSVMAQQRMLQTAIALKRFHLTNKRYPATLDELTPYYLLSLPLDPIDGKPLRYRLEANGDYTLYSIGINGVDDGGNGEEVTPEKVPKWNADKTYDIVWPRMKK